MSSVAIAARATAVAVDGRQEISMAMGDAAATESHMWLTRRHGEADACPVASYKLRKCLGRLTD